MIDHKVKFISKARLLRILAAGYPYEVEPYKASYKLKSPPTHILFRLASTLNCPYLVTFFKYSLLTVDLHNDIITNYPEYLI